MAKYVQSFQDRDDVSDKLKTGLKVDALLITGSKSSSLKACDAMFQNCNKVCFDFLSLIKNYIKNPPMIYMDTFKRQLIYNFRHEPQSSGMMTSLTHLAKLKLSLRTMFCFL